MITMNSVDRRIQIFLLTLKFCFTRSLTAVLVVVALGSRLKLDFPFIDFFGVLQEHILSQFFYFWVCFQNLT